MQFWLIYIETKLEYKFSFLIFCMFKANASISILET